MSQGKTWRDRQRRVLTQLRVDSGRTRTSIAADVGLEYWQLTRLETGKTELPAKILPSLARAYGVEPQQIITALELSEPTLHDLLTAIGMPDDEQRQLLSSLAGQDTTAEERLAIATFVAEVLDKRKHAPPQARRQA